MRGGLKIALLLFTVGSAAAEAGCASFIVDLLRRGPSAAYRLARGTAALNDLHPDLSFKSLQALAQEVMRHQDPDHAIFIGIGRSPFPITSYVNLVHPGGAYTVPLSYRERLPLYQRLVPYSPRHAILTPYSWGKRQEYRYRVDSAGLAHAERVWIPAPHLRANIFRLLDRYFPPPEKLARKKAVLIDFADFGWSLAYSYLDVEAWKRARGYDFKVEVMFLHDRPGYPGTYWGEGRWETEVFKTAAIAPPAYRTIDLWKFPRVGKLFASGSLKAFSPYPHFMPVSRAAEDPMIVPANPRFAEFERALRNAFEQKAAAPELVWF